MSHPLQGEQDKLLGELIAAAVKAERERIADLLIYSQGNPLIRAMECNENGCYPASAIELRKHLEPK
jgi:hypothetical protein